MCFQRAQPSRRLSFNICLYILYLLIKYYLIYLRTHNIIYAASFDYFNSIAKLREKKSEMKNSLNIKSLCTERNEMSLVVLLKDSV